MSADKPKYSRDDWQSEEAETSDGRKGVYFITISTPDGEELATIIHRTCDGTYPLDGALARVRAMDADRIVDALNRATA